MSTTDEPMDDANLYAYQSKPDPHELMGSEDDLDHPSCPMWSTFHWGIILLALIFGTLQVHLDRFQPVLSLCGGLSHLIYLCGDVG